MRPKKIHNLTLFEISKFFLSLLIISINIREPFFHSREIFLFLFILTSFNFANYKNLFFSLLLLSIWSISVVFNTIIKESNITFFDGGFETIIASIYLFLLCFSKKEYAAVILKSYLFSSLLVALLTVVLWIVCSLNSGLYELIKSYFFILKENKNLMVISIDKRNILGNVFMTVYYRTSPTIICSLGYCLASRLNGSKRYTWFIIFLSFALFFSGARANMLCVFLLLFFYFIFFLLKKKCFSTAFMLCLSVLIISVFFVFAFLFDTNSASSNIKINDTKSYFNTYAEDPLRFFLFGWGPGSWFYTSGRNVMMNVTELSHFETIRRYGLVSTFLIFIFIWLRPLKFKLSYNMKTDVLFYWVCIFAYIFTACTNPFREIVKCCG